MYTFNDIIGHEEIIKHLQSAINKNKISHAYIIDGEKGMGKKLIANTFAKTMQCKLQGDTPCNTCVSCLTFNSGNHPDIIYVKPTKKTGIGVNDIREQINKDINIKPYHYPYKIYIVDNAHLMTEQAQNALLKTIEEPPSYVVIILLSNNINHFLPTILSRCVNLRLKPLSPEKIKTYITGELKIEDYRTDLITSFAQGIIGKARELALSTEFIDMREDMIKVTETIIQGDEFELMALVGIFEEYKDQVEDCLDLLLTWYRDLLIVKKIEDENYVIHTDKYKTLLKQSHSLSYNKISMIIDNIKNAQEQLRYNTNFQLAIELMLMKTKEK